MNVLYKIQVLSVFLETITKSEAKWSLANFVSVYTTTLVNIQIVRVLFC